MLWKLYESGLSTNRGQVISRGGQRNAQYYRLLLCIHQTWGKKEVITLKDGGEAFHSSEAGFYVSLCLLYMWGCVNFWNSGHPGALFVSPSRSCGQWTWGGKCWLRCQSCAVSKKKLKKIAIRWADRRNNKHGGLERRLNKYKGRETGRKRGQIRCWIVEFIVRRTAPSPTTREPRDDPPSFFFFLRKLCLPASSGDPNTASWQLSKAFCQMTLAPWLFCQIRDRFSYLFFSHHNNKDLYTVVQNV